MKEKTQFVICIKNAGCEDDVHVKSVYHVLDDEAAARSQYLRIIDETGEDYLFPAAYFVRIDLPQEAEHAVLTPSVGATRAKRGARKRIVRKTPTTTPA